MRKVFVFLGLVAFGCSSENTGGSIVVDSGEYYDYTTTSLKLPTSTAEQIELAFNVDGDEQGKPDNKLGYVFILLSENDVDIQAANDDALASGRLSLPHRVRADDLKQDASVSWQVGDLEPVVGSIDANTFEGGPGAVTVSLMVSENAPALVLPLIAARVRADIDASACTGKIGGAITAEDLDQQLLPVVAEMFSSALERDCPEGTCPEGSSGALISEVFDADKDGVVTVDELRENSILQSLTKPDVDLLGDDGVNDSISFGVGFTCAAL